MLIENIEINLDTNKTFEIIDITSKINEIIIYFLNILHQLFA